MIMLKSCSISNHDLFCAWTYFGPCRCTMQLGFDCFWGAAIRAPQRKITFVKFETTENLRIIHLQNHTEYRMGWADTQKVHKHTQMALNLHLDQSV